MSASCGTRHPILSFSIYGSMILLLIAISSAWWHAGHWRGVLVTDAGDDTLNGYYFWVGQPNKPLYQRNIRNIGSLLPDVFTLSLLEPFSASILGSDSVPDYRLQQDVKGHWGIGPNNQKFIYITLDAPPKKYQVPPTTGWHSLDTKPKSNISVVPNVYPVWRKQTSVSKKRRGAKIVEVLSNLIEYPGTLLFLSLNFIVALQLFFGRVSVGSVAFSYELVLEHNEYWRAITATFSHFELMHFGFNMMSLYNLAGLEKYLGSVRYIYYTVALVVVTMALLLCMLHILIKMPRFESLRSTKSVGYSCVIFAFITMTSVLQEEFCPIPFIPALCFDTWHVPVPFFGITMLSINVAPLVLLVVIQVFLPRAAFLGHFSGIIAGYALAWGWLDMLQPPILACICVFSILQRSSMFPWCICPITSTTSNHSNRNGGEELTFNSCNLLAFTSTAQFGVAVFKYYTMTSAGFFAEIGILGVSLLSIYAYLQLVKSFRSDQDLRELTFCVEQRAATLLLGQFFLLLLLSGSDALTLGASIGKSAYLTSSGIVNLALKQWGVLLSAYLHLISAVAIAVALTTFREGRGWLKASGFKNLACSRLLAVPFSGQGYALVPSRNALDGVSV